ncbi:hypothetical protein NP493_974g00000 [Ridgeia piscesae]|uniref:Solute carrier family 23 member 1 n=1 Tax=Ridgeia piscesae TaxID=27915 RepID=A0AAD9NJ84_RIDPI|nr:hypothetical protein NP493_974g00000 [Ridgeia piscesae]
MAALFEVFIGLFGIVGFLMRFIGPITVAPTIILIGLSLSTIIADMCGKHWWIALMTTVLLGLFTQCMKKITIPCTKPHPQTKRKRHTRIFQLYAVLLAIVTSVVVCAILTVSGALPSSPDEWGYEARTDTRLRSVEEARWFQMPYPGIFMEGVGCIIAGLFGTGVGCTSYSGNIAAIGLTKIGSRRVIQVGAGLVIFVGMFGKFGALIGLIPVPVIGGLMLAVMGMICTIGMSNLQVVDMNSSRNLFILGVSLFTGIVVPPWVKAHTGSVDLGNATVNQAIVNLLTTSMTVGGVIAFVLDNTLPGTLEERGMRRFAEKTKSFDSLAIENDSTSGYDLPFGMTVIRRLTFLRYLPISPTHGQPRHRFSETAPEQHINEGCTDIVTVA